MAESEKVTTTPTESATEVSSSNGALDEAREKLRRVAGQFQERYQKVSGDVRRGADRATREIRKSTEQAGSELRQTAKKGGAAAREKIDLATDSLRQGYGRVRQDVEAASQDVNDYVKKQPGRAVMFAAGIGFLAGLLLRGRRKD